MTDPNRMTDKYIVSGVNKTHSAAACMGLCYTDHSG